MRDLRTDPRVEFGRAQARLFLSELGARRPPVDPHLDRVLEERFQIAVGKQFPGDSVFGEELPPVGVWGGDGWLIDPIDGTSNLRQGLPWFGTSIAYLRGGRPVLGWVCDPSRGEIYEAIEGYSATVEQVPMTLPSLPPSPLVATSRRWCRSHPGWRTDLPPGVKDRLLGATALELAWVARGLLGAGAWGETRTFDIAAGWLLLREAGAVIYSSEGRGRDASWPPLLDGDPTAVRLDLVAGHPAHEPWLKRWIPHSGVEGEVESRA